MPWDNRTRGVRPARTLLRFRPRSQPVTRPCMSSRLTIGFLGAGKMATALAKGFIRASLVAAEDVLASDPSQSACAAFVKETGGRTTTSNAEVAKNCQVLILAVKPDQVAAVLAEIRESFTQKHLLLSIAAGVPLGRLESELGA